VSQLADYIRRNSRPDDNGCWIWQKSTLRNGYGQFRKKQKHYYAHRASYEVFKGPIRDGLFVCHTCDVRACVNPDHLWLGTTTDNIRDAWSKGRMKPIPVTKGEEQYAAKLTEDNVRDILTKRLTTYEFADLYGVSPANISHIWTGRNWRHVSGLPNRRRA
jgi:hypothetical protein